MSLFVRSLALVVAIAPLFAACSSAPAESEGTEQAAVQCPGCIAAPISPSPVCTTSSVTVVDEGCSVGSGGDTSVQAQFKAAGFNCSTPQLYYPPASEQSSYATLDFMTCPNGYAPLSLGGESLGTYVHSMGGQTASYAGPWLAGDIALENNRGQGVCTACLGPAPEGQIYVFWFPKIMPGGKPSICTGSCMSPRGI